MSFIARSVTEIHIYKHSVGFISSPKVPKQRNFLSKLPLRVEWQDSNITLCLTRFGNSNISFYYKYFKHFPS